MKRVLVALAIVAALFGGFTSEQASAHEYVHHYECKYGRIWAIVYGHPYGSIYHIPVRAYPTLGTCGP